MHRLLHETLRFPVGIRLSKLFPKANTHPHTLPPQAPIHYSFYSNSGATHQALPLASRLHQQPEPPRSLMDFMSPPDKYMMSRPTSGLTDRQCLLNNMHKCRSQTRLLPTWFGIESTNGHLFLRRFEFGKFGLTLTKENNYFSSSTCKTTFL